jgi:hypothetical protein
MRKGGEEENNTKTRLGRVTGTDWGSCCPSLLLIAKLAGALMLVVPVTVQDGVTIQDHGTTYHNL